MNVVNQRTVDADFSQGWIRCAIRTGAAIIAFLFVTAGLAPSARADDDDEALKIAKPSVSKSSLSKPSAYPQVPAAYKAKPDDDDDDVRPVIFPSVLSVLGSDALVVKPQDDDDDKDHDRNRDDKDKYDGKKERDDDKDHDNKDHDRVARGPAEGRHDFGRVSVLDHPQVQHSFRIKNITKTPLVILSLHPSCACTTVSLKPVIGAHDQPVDAHVRNASGLLTLAPGQETDVRIQVDLTDSGPAVLTKTVTIFVQGNPLPVGYLTMTGTIVPSVTFEPAFLDFGSREAGRAFNLTIKAKLDSRLMAKGTVPTLISTNPDIQVVSQTLSGEKPPQTKPPTTEKPYKEMTYLVTLTKNAPLGSLSGSLSFVPGIAVASSATGAPSQAQVSALTRVSALVLGQVTGDVSPLPAQVAFGTIHAGRQATRQIVLTGVDDNALAGITVSSASPWLTTRLGNLNEQPVFGNGGQPVPSSRVLYLTISSDAPAAVLQTQIKASLPNGQRLLLPVSADIIAASSGGF